MGRPIVLSNGELHVGINKFGLVHDFYYPYVGLENHAAGKSLRHRVGTWAEQHISWLDDESEDWTFSFHYPHGALIGHTLARNESLGILLEFDDFVDSQMSAFVRNIHIVNLRDYERDIRLFMHQAFVIGDSRSNTDTAQFLPDNDAILHYRGRRAFVIAGSHGDSTPFDQHSIGLFGIEGREGTYRDADDGELSMSAVEHGRVDSTLRFRQAIPAHDSARVHYWIGAGTSLREALYVHNQMKDDGVQKRLHATAAWWQNWLLPAEKIARKLEPGYRDSFIRSLMIVKSQLDKRGAVIASTDTTMLNYSRDAYGYSWPRDGAFVLWPLIRMGYIDEPYRFFEFCRRGLHSNGYLLHKYRADGAVGSSWHPYIHDDGSVSPPIQEDETALVLFVFAQYYRIQNNPHLLEEFYHSLVVPMAAFLASYVDHATGLPRPSYDLWEERYLTTTYTTSVTYAALQAAADLADAMNDADNAVQWRAVADDMYQGAHKHLFNESRQAFYKGVIPNGEGGVAHDETIDMSSIFGAFMFGLFPSDSSELKAAIQTAETLFKPEENNGFPRYEHDNYHRESSDIYGNSWIITTLWMAQYYLETDQKDRVSSLLSWVRSHESETGVLPEQINPKTNEFVSVAPLTWSHAEYIATLLDTITEGVSHDQ